MKNVSTFKPEVKNRRIFDTKSITDFHDFIVLSKFIVQTHVH